MAQISFESLPEVFVSTTDTSILVSRAVKNGTLRHIGSKLYTKALDEDPAAVVRRNLWQLVAAYVPGALIADRTALENAPSADGSVFVVADRKRDIAMPGIIIRVRRGQGHVEGDNPFIGGLYLASTARAYLDNMAPSRKRGEGVSRTLSRAEIETRLDDLVRRSGVDGANRLRDEARRLAPTLGREAEFEEFDKLLGSLLGTREEPLATPRGNGRRQGRPYDPDRLRLFEALHTELRATSLVTRLTPERDPAARASLAFFEAYFSNFIEGTEFEVDEAAAIVFQNVIPRERPQDAHDVLGTWRIVSDRSEMSRLPKDTSQLFEILKARHAAVMGGRPDKSPGEFKEASNRAGQTVFVAPEDVRGTLELGFDFYRSLETPFARAVFMMFLISEVHPFADGNGRVARIMMNAELVAAGEERILIPTIYRSNYLSALKALSTMKHPTPLVRTLDFAQRWVAAIPWTDVENTRIALDSTNAFEDPAAADDAGVRLKLFTV